MKLGVRRVKFTFSTLRIGLLVGAVFTSSVATRASQELQLHGPIDLGTFGGLETQALAVTEDGVVFGSGSTPGETQSHLFRWTQANGREDLGTLQYITVDIKGVSRDGRVVVGHNYGGGSSLRQWVWSETTGLIDPLPNVAEARVNDVGVVYGYMGVSTDSHAFIWTEAGGIVDLHAFGKDSWARAVNTAGVVVGTVLFPPQPGGAGSRAFRWTAATGMVDLGLPFGTWGAEATDVNDSGVVVGYAYFAPQSFIDPRVFMWSPTGGFVDLGPGSGTVNINNSGLVTGSDGINAWLWTAATGRIDLSLGGEQSIVSGMTESGFVIGAATRPAESTFTPFFWSQSTGILDIGNLGGNVSWAYSVTENGLVVGYGTTAGGSADRAFVWTRYNGIVDLGTLGGSYTYAFAANSSGLIAGLSSLPGDIDYRAVVWAPPNTALGDDVVVSPPAILPTGEPAPLSLTFDNVSSTGNTTVTTSDTGIAPPSGFKLTDSPVYYDIETTAQFTGPIRLCLGWVEGQIVDESQARLFHYEGDQWVDITDVSSLDTEANRICGDAASLSPFAVFQVEYSFAGFFQPIDNGSVVNSVKAGAAVPVRFSLGGFRGLNVFADGYPRAQRMQCATGAPLATIEETVSAGSSALSYDQGTDRYTFVWKTDRAWAGSCRELQVLLSDGELYTARFSFAR